MPYVFDLPCGYTHRGLDMADAGKNYIGGDLPAVISDIRPAIEAMATPDELEKISFAEVDVTDVASMRIAVKSADGEICIATEGLTGVNTGVREILETTGFIEFFEIA